MVALLSTHPLDKGLKTVFRFCKKRAFPGSKRHLHKLVNEFQVSPEKTKKMTPICHCPKWVTDTTISIAGKEKDAISEEETAHETLRVYSDGSAVDGGVGGAAVLMRRERMCKERRFHLGSNEEHTVYEAEIVGMILAVQLLREAGGKGTMALGVDNQAAIRTTGAYYPPPGHYLVDMFHNDLRKLLPDEDERKLMIRWTPGHKGIEGNEEADRQAKRAARGEASAGKRLPKSLRTKTKNPVKLPLVTPPKLRVEAAA